MNTVVRQTSNRKPNGFSFIELLVVTVIMVVLTTVAVVSYRSGAVATRDARRKKDAGNIRVALEAYRQAYGSYPDPVSCSGGSSSWGWSNCNAVWIENLEPDFIDDLGADPRQDLGWNGYGYHKVSDTAYELVVYLENDDPLSNGSLYGLDDNAYVQTQPN